MISHKWQIFFAEQLPDHARVLDIGVGTGELIKELLQLKPLDLVGVDFSSEMIQQAKVKLAGTSAKLYCMNILDFEDEQPFDAIISSGGVIYYVKDEQEYRLYSHIVQPEQNEKLLQKLQKLLRVEGQIYFTIQGAHRNYSKLLKPDLIYQQEIEEKPRLIKKWYEFLNEEGKILSRQYCEFLYYTEQETDVLFLKNLFSGKKRFFLQTRR